MLFLVWSKPQLVIKTTATEVGLSVTALTVSVGAIAAPNCVGTLVAVKSLLIWHLHKVATSAMIIVLQRTQKCPCGYFICAKIMATGLIAQLAPQV